MTVGQQAICMELSELTSIGVVYVAYVPFSSPIAVGSYAVRLLQTFSLRLSPANSIAWRRNAQGRRLGRLQEQRLVQSCRVTVVTGQRHTLLYTDHP